MSSCPQVLASPFCYGSRGEGIKLLCTQRKKNVSILQSAVRELLVEFMSSRRGLLVVLVGFGGAKIDNFLVLQH